MPGTPHPTHGLRRPSQPTSSPTSSDPRWSAPLVRSASDDEGLACSSTGSGSGSGVNGSRGEGRQAMSAAAAAAGERLIEGEGPGAGGGHPLQHDATFSPPRSPTSLQPASQQPPSGLSSPTDRRRPSPPPSPPAGPEALLHPRPPRRRLSTPSGSASASASGSGLTSSSPSSTRNHPSLPHPPLPPPSHPSSSPVDPTAAPSSSTTHSSSSTRSTPAHSQPPTSTAPTTSSSGTVNAGVSGSKAVIAGAGGGSTSASPSSTTSAAAAAHAASSPAGPPVRAGLKGMALAARQAKSTSTTTTTMAAGSSLAHGPIDGTLCDDLAAGPAPTREGEPGEHPLSEQSLDRRGYHSFLCLGRPFHVEKRWKLVRELGQGAYGLVVSAQDDISGETIAIKMVTRVLDKVVLARRALREITLLRHFASHENITGLIDLDVVHPGFNEVYMFMEPMEADLHQIIRSGQLLSNAHVQYFMYQLLRGMKYIHSAHVLHRDIKPGNVLVNADCELKICDFGLARGFYPDGLGTDASGGSPLTEYVATRWYRAPEIMLSYRKYTTAIDVWSVGCILGELLGAKPIFKGKDYVDQLNLILGVLGTPDDETLTRVGSAKACKYIQSLAPVAPIDLAALYPEADELAIDLLSKLLVFDPARRMSVVEALEHPYLASYHDESDEPSCPAPFDKWVEVESLTHVDDFRKAIETEVREFRAEVRAVDELDPPWTAAEDAGIDGGEPSNMLVSGESPMPDPPGSRYVADMLSAAEAAGEGGRGDAVADDDVGGDSESGSRRTSTIGGQTSDESPERRHEAATGGGGPREGSVEGGRSGSPGSFPASGSATATAASSGPASPQPSAHPLRPHAHSRSASSIYRRPSSGFFDPFGRRPASLAFTPSPSASATQSPANSSEVVRPPRSRHHSASGDTLIRPLLRSLSTISVTDALGNGLALGGFSKMSPAPPISPAPMAVSPSDAPPSAPPLQLRPSSEKVPLV